MTSETKLNHTPAPWIWGSNARLYADPNLPECQRVMNVQLGKTTALCWDERDARLIAAAPDLLAALIELSNYVFDEYSASHPLCERAMEARELIKRVKGATG